jgi:hypothetical protein
VDDAGLGPGQHVAVPLRRRVLEVTRVADREGEWRVQGRAVDGVGAERDRVRRGRHHERAGRLVRDLSHDGAPARVGDGDPERAAVDRGRPGRAAHGDRVGTDLWRRGARRRSRGEEQ